VSTAELIETIKALPPEKQKQVVLFIQHLQTQAVGKETVAFEKAADSVFAKHGKLLSELAK